MPVIAQILYQEIPNSHDFMIHFRLAVGINLLAIFKSLEHAKFLTGEPEKSFPFKKSMAPRVPHRSE